MHTLDDVWAPHKPVLFIHYPRKYKAVIDAIISRQKQAPLVIEFSLSQDFSFLELAILGNDSDLNYLDFTLFLDTLLEQFKSLEIEEFGIYGTLKLKSYGFKQIYCFGKVYNNYLPKDVNALTLARTISHCKTLFV